MAEYTRKDIIMDPKDSRLENAIGKKVFSSSDINLLLNRANNDEYEMTLTQVEDVDSEPFTVTDMDGDEIDADFIILKKEEPKPEYVPFENAEEFLNAYDYTNHSVEHGTVENKLLNYGGIWLKHRESDDFFMVLEIRDDGVVIRRNLFTTSWNDLSNDYTFLDGTFCGKEAEDE